MNKQMNERTEKKYSDIFIVFLLIAKRLCSALNNNYEKNIIQSNAQYP